MTLAERINALKEELGVNRAQMARDTHIDTSNLYLIEKGQTKKLTISTIYRFNSAYGVNPDYLRGTSDLMFLDGQRKKPKPPKPETLPLALENNNNLDWLMGLSAMDNSKLSRITGVPRGKIIELKVGKTPLDVNSAMSLAYFFDCDVEFLMGDGGFIKIYLPRIAEPLLLEEDDFDAIGGYLKSTKINTGKRIEIIWGKQKKAIGGMKVIRILLPKYLPLLSTDAQIRAKLLYLREEEKKELLSKI